MLWCKCKQLFELHKHKCSNQVFMCFLPLLMCFFKFWSPFILQSCSFISSILVSLSSQLLPLSMFCANLSPFIINFHKIWHHLIYILEMSGLTPLGILGRHHTWWRWSLEVFLDCFYELPSLWLELVDFHNKLQTLFEPSSTFFTRLWAIILLRLNLSLV